MYGRCINGNTSGRHRVLRSLNNGMFKLKYASKTHDEKKGKYYLLYSGKIISEYDWWILREPVYIISVSHSNCRKKRLKLDI